MDHRLLVLVVLFVSSSLAEYVSDYRLPTTTVPKHYRLVLELNPDSAGGIIGETHIKVTAKAKTDSIVLHSSGIQIGKISVADDKGVQIFSKYSQVTDKDFLKIDLKSNLTEQLDYDVSIWYWAPLGSLDGIYRSYYKDDDGEMRWLISTQFAPTSARKGFPCYDEPGIKAEFSVEIHNPEKYNATSNMDVKSITPSYKEGYKMTSFNTTPIMSTYLVAFAVSTFSQKSFGNFHVNSRNSALNQIDYALNVGNKSLKALNDYLGVDYRMPKMDIFAIPDFLFNAMENWGLTTYKEEVLLYDKKETPADVQKKITTVISHENAHNWFGNEVTHAWWGYVWLKEGFATYFENFITDIMEESFRQMEQFVVHTLQETMLFDSLMYTNPMSSSVETPSDFMNNYNYVAYPKAGSVIRMIRNGLGEEIFRKGLTDYLKSHPTGTAVPDDLFASLQKAVDDDSDVLPKNLTVKMIFSSWSDQASYPLVHAHKDNATNHVVVTQERYYQNKSLHSEEIWWIPIRTISASKRIIHITTPEFWMGPNNTISSPLDKDDQWFIVNPLQMGYYRVNYDTENWIKLTELLNSEKFTDISPLNRAHLIDDAFELAKTGRLPYKIALDLASYLKQETDYIPWVSAQRALGYITAQFHPNSYATSIMLQKFKKELVEKLYESTGFHYEENDDIVTKSKRGVASILACEVGVDGCREELDKTANLMSTENATMHPDLRNQAYCRYLTNSPYRYNDTWQRYLQSNFPSEKTILLRSMSCARVKEILERYLALSIGDGYDIRNHDRTAIVIAAIKSEFPIAAAFLKKSYLTLQQKSQSPNAMARVLEAMANKIKSSDDKKAFVELNDMYSANFSTSERAASLRALEIIALNEHWRNTYLEEIDEWLKAKYNSANGVIASLFLIITSVIINLLY